MPRARKAQSKPKVPKAPKSPKACVMTTKRKTSHHLATVAQISVHAIVAAKMNSTGTTTKRKAAPKRIQKAGRPRKIKTYRRLALHIMYYG